MKKLEQQLTDYVNYCKDVKRLSPLTVEARRSLFRRFANEIPAKDVSHLSNKMIDDWLTEKRCRGSSANTYVIEIKTMIRFFRSQGEKVRKVDLDKICRVKEEPRKKVFYTREQIDEVLAQCDDLEWLLIRLSFDCGLRIRELQSLSLSNIDGQKISFLGKGRKLREVYMSEEARRHLDRWISEQGVTDRLWEYRYKNGATQPIAIQTINRIERNAFIRLGYTDFHPHALRHSFATEICRNGAPLHVARDMLGHSNIQTTIRYVHSLDGQLKEAFDKYRRA